MRVSLHPRFPYLLNEKQGPVVCSLTNHPGGFETFMHAEHQTLFSFPDSPTWEIHAI